MGGGELSPGSSSLTNEKGVASSASCHREHQGLVKGWGWGEKVGPHFQGPPFQGGGDPKGGVRLDQDSSSMLKLLRRLLALETAGETEESRGSEAALSGDSTSPDSAPITPSSSSIRMSSSPR